MGVYISIDAPNLVSFNLNNAKLLKISIEAPCLLEHSFVTLREHPFNKPKIDDNWYTSLIEFISQFGCCKSLRLNCYIHQTVFSLCTLVQVQIRLGCSLKFATLI